MMGVRMPSAMASLALLRYTIPNLWPKLPDAKAPWADTGTGRLIIAVLGGLADVERDLIRTRTAEGCGWARKRGQFIGRLPKLKPVRKAEACRARAEGAPRLLELALSYEVGKSTISRP
jgi:DNA invertase Pin-like site-specific DNA recombinase